MLRTGGGRLPHCPSSTGAVSRHRRRPRRGQGLLRRGLLWKSLQGKIPIRAGFGVGSLHRSWGPEATVPPPATGAPLRSPGHHRAPPSPRQLRPRWACGGDREPRGRRRPPAAAGPRGRLRPGPGPRRETDSPRASSRAREGARTGGAGAAPLTAPRTPHPDAALRLLLGLRDAGRHLLPLGVGSRAPNWTQMLNKRPVGLPLQRRPVRLRAPPPPLAACLCHPHREPRRGPRSLPPPTPAGRLRGAGAGGGPSTRPRSLT